METSHKPASAGQRTSGPTLRTYRLALAATAEYTAFQSRNLPAGSTRADSVAAAQAAIVTSVNRVVGVYEKELAVRMVLVAGNSQLVYTPRITPTPTPTTMGKRCWMKTSSMWMPSSATATTISATFSARAAAALPALGVVCQTGGKAQGVTGSPSPVADAFDIDYVAHEMGHQFGGDHTFNGTAGSCGSGNRNADTGLRARLGHHDYGLRGHLRGGQQHAG